MRHLTAQILWALALVQTSSSDSTYTPTPAADPSAQLDNVQNFAYNAAMGDLGGTCTQDNVQIRREWYVNCSKSASSQTPPKSKRKWQ
jgi:hypothetical protein